MLKSYKYIVAPMVDVSFAPFRVLCRQHGAHLAYTPMHHATGFSRSQRYRNSVFDDVLLTDGTEYNDAPLVLQFASSNVEDFVSAAKFVADESRVMRRLVSLDLNLGCPVKKAKSGGYGAALLDNAELACAMIRAVRSEVPQVPVSCKMRIVDDLDVSVRYARALADAGCQMLAVHGRTPAARSNKVAADWQAIRRVRDSVAELPFVANGSVERHAQLDMCLEATGADAVMVGTGAIANPAVFSCEQPSPPALAIEFVELSLALSRRHGVEALTARGVKPALAKLACTHRLTSPSLVPPPKPPSELIDVINARNFRAEQTLPLLEHWQQHWQQWQQTRGGVGGGQSKMNKFYVH
jgi:tRNA-dihydrouridine synthase 1